LSAYYIGLVDGVLEVDTTRVIKSPVRARTANTLPGGVIATIRQECLGRMLILGHRHLTVTSERSLPNTSGVTTRITPPVSKATLSLCATLATMSPPKPRRGGRLGGFIRKHSIVG